MSKITVNELISSALQKYCDANDRNDPCLLVNRKSIEVSKSDIEGSTTIGFTNAANDTFELVCSNVDGKLFRESWKMGTASGGGDGALTGCNGSTKATVPDKSTADVFSTPDTTIWANDTHKPADTAQDTPQSIDTIGAGDEVCAEFCPETAGETATFDAPTPPDTTSETDSDALIVRPPKDATDVEETAVVTPQEDTTDAEAGVSGEVATGAEAEDAAAEATGVDVPVAGNDTPVAGVDTPAAGEDTPEPQDNIVLISYDVPSQPLQGVIFAIDPNQDQCYVTDPVNTAACVTLVHQDDEFNAAHLFNGANSPLKVKIQKSGNAKEPADFDVVEDIPSFKQYTQLESLDITDSTAVWSIVKYTDVSGIMKTSEIVGKVTTSIDYLLNTDTGEFYQGYNMYINGKANFGGTSYDCIWKNPPEENTPTPSTCGKEPIE